MKKQYYFESGSSALLFSLLSEKEKSQTIFLPEFICNNLVERLKNNKIQIDYYKIKNDKSDIDIKMIIYDILSNYNIDLSSDNDFDSVNKLVLSIYSQIYEITNINDISAISWQFEFSIFKYKVCGTLDGV